MKNENNSLEDKLIKNKKPFQFNLSNLFNITAGIAITLGTSKFLGSKLLEKYSYEEFSSGAIDCYGYAGMIGLVSYISLNFGYRKFKLRNK